MKIKKANQNEFWRDESVIADFGGDPDGPASAQFLELCEVIVGAAPSKRPRVLDVGCGVGSLARSLPRNARARYVGVDPSLGMITEARKRNPRREFVIGDLMNLYHVLSGKFDVFFAINCLQYITRGRLETALGMIRSRLRKGAVGYIQLSDGTGVSHIQMGTRRTESYDWTPELLLPQLWKTDFMLGSFRRIYYGAEQHPYGEYVVIAK